MTAHGEVLSDARSVYAAMLQAGSGKTGAELCDEFDAAIRSVKFDAWADGAAWAAVQAGAIQNVRQPFVADGENPYDGTVGA